MNIETILGEKHTLDYAKWNRDFGPDRSKPFCLLVYAAPIPFESAPFRQWKNFKKIILRIIVSFIKRASLYSSGTSTNAAKAHSLVGNTQKWFCFRYEPVYTMWLGEAPHVVIMDARYSSSLRSFRKIYKNGVFNFECIQITNNANLLQAPTRASSWVAKSWGLSSNRSRVS